MSINVIFVNNCRIPRCMYSYFLRLYLFTRNCCHSVCVFVLDFVACILCLKINQVSGNVVSTIRVIQILVHVGHIHFKHFPKLKIERQHEDILTLTRQFKEMLCTCFWFKEVLRMPLNPYRLGFVGNEPHPMFINL